MNLWQSKPDEWLNLDLVSRVAHIPAKPATPGNAMSAVRMFPAEPEQLVLEFPAPTGRRIFSDASQIKELLGILKPPNALLS